jgi:hypothetical protein
LIGSCGLRHIPWQAFFTPAVESGWRLSTRWQGKGLAREAAEAALNFAFASRAGSRRQLHRSRQHGLLGPDEAPGHARSSAEFENPDLPEGHPSLEDKPINKSLH